MDWEAEAKGILKSELKRRGVSYARLVVLLGELGVEESEPNIRNKLSRGRFSAIFFLQCLVAIGARDLKLP